jgi:hypothetical protein
MAIEAKLLVGWMTREAAILWLTKECLPPKTEQEAVELWEQYNQRTEALQPEAPSLPQTLSKSERSTREMFLRHCYQQKKQDVEDVIKLDLATLPIRQFRVIAPRSANYQAQVASRAGWISKALPTANPPDLNLQVRYNQEGTDTEAWFEIPHNEFMMPFDPAIGGFQLRMGDRWVEAMRVDQRYLLWAGYHRSLARLVNTIGDGIERSALVALTRNRLLDTPNQLPDIAHARALCLRARPPLLKDFLDDALCMTLNLRKQKYVYHVRGEVLATEDAS